MKKSVLTTLIATSALFTGVAFAGNYAADANYTTADTAAVASDDNLLSHGIYVGLGLNRTSQGKASETTTFDSLSTEIKLDTTNYGYGVLVGKHVNDVFALELGYSAYGKNSFNNAEGEVVTDYYQTRSTSLVGVANSDSFYGISAHAKLGAAYLSQKTKSIPVTGETVDVSYAAGILVFGFGVQYAIDAFDVSLDWTRFQNNNTTHSSSNEVYFPDEFSLNFIYNFA